MLRERSLEARDETAKKVSPTSREVGTSSLSFARAATLPRSASAAQKGDGAHYDSILRWARRDAASEDHTISSAPNVAQPLQVACRNASAAAGRATRESWSSTDRSGQIGLRHFRHKRSPP